LSVVTNSAGPGPPPSEPGDVPTDDPEWVKDVVAKALLHATNAERAPLAPTPATPVPGAWPTMKTELPDFSGRPFEEPVVPALSSRPSTPSTPPTQSTQLTPPRLPKQDLPKQGVPTQASAPTTSAPEPAPDPATIARAPDLPPVPPPVAKQPQQLAPVEAPEPALVPQETPAPQETLPPEVSDLSPAPSAVAAPSPAPSTVASAIVAHERPTAPQDESRALQPTVVGTDGVPFEDRRQSSVSVANPSRSEDEFLMEESDATTEGYRSSDLRTILEWLAVIVAALSVALLIKAFVLQAFWIPSVSMETTVNEGDRILVNKVSYRLHEVRRGDLVVFKKLPGTGGNTDDLIKRAIALPGETIEVRDDGRIWIWGAGETPEDAKRLEEPYLSPDDAFLNVPNSASDPSAFGHENCANGPSPTRCTLGPESYFMMGDNRNLSQDSRSFGPIPEENIVGRAFLRIWPIGDIDSL